MLAASLIIVGLMLLNGVFAGAEIAVLSVRKTRLAELVDGGGRRARAVQWLRHTPERFLATVQIGITVVGTTAAAFGGDRLAEGFGHWLGVHVPALGPRAETLGLGLVVVMISMLEIVVGELVPKSLALRSAERYSLLVGPALRWLAVAARPFVWLLTTISNGVLRLFGDRTSFAESRLSPDEIQEMIEEAARANTLDPRAAEIASRALDFRDRHASDVMVARRAIVSVERKADAAALLAALGRRRFARLPVYDGEADNFVGYLAVKDAFAWLIAGRFTVDAVLRPVLFVPATVRATELLRQMQSQRQPLAIVVDETGGVLGLVTIEDLVEELVGDILSEQDPLPDALTRGPDGSVVMPGTTALREVNRALGLELPEPEGFSTVAGLCLDLAGRIPETGVRLELPDGASLEVVEASRRQVRTVRWRPAATE